MGRRLRLEPHLMVEELARRYWAAKEPHERNWWQILWLLSQGRTATEVAASTGYSRYWIGQMVRRYNTEGLEAMQNRQYTHSHRAQPLLSPAPRCSRNWPRRCVARLLKRNTGSGAR